MDYSFIGNGGGSYPKSITSMMMSKYKLTWLCECATRYIGVKCEHEGIIYHCKYQLFVLLKHEICNI